VARIGSNGDAEDDGHERRPAQPPTHSKRGNAKVELEPRGQIVRRQQTLEVSPHKPINDGAPNRLPPDAALTQTQ
jgi:hypothetical protein